MEPEGANAPGGKPGDRTAIRSLRQLRQPVKNRQTRWTGRSESLASRQTPTVLKD